MILQVKVNMEKGTNQLIKLGKMSHHNFLIRRNYWEKKIKRKCMWNEFATFLFSDTIFLKIVPQMIS